MIRRIDIRRKPGQIAHKGLFSFNNKTIECSLGKTGITTKKREGDGATPVGRYKILYGFFRKNHNKRIQTALEMIPIEANSGWCDAPTHNNYNQYVDLPFNASHEKIYRDDRLYDVCLVLDYNISTRKRFAGSAIFFHLTRADKGPTEGCIAIDPKDMDLLLSQLSQNTELVIHG